MSKGWIIALLCLALPAQTASQDYWDYYQTVHANAGGSGNIYVPVLRSSLGDTSLSIQGSFSNCSNQLISCYQCCFSRNNLQMCTSAIFSNETKLYCPVAQWGLTYEATKVELKIYKDMKALKLENGPFIHFYIYMMEDISEIIPNPLSGFDQLMTIRGAGFVKSKQYSCFLFREGGWKPLSLQGYSSLNLSNGIPMQVVNVSTGLCPISTNESAFSANVSIAYQNYIFDSLRPVNRGKPQPIITHYVNFLTRFLAGAFFYRSVPVSFYDTWSDISKQSASAAGGGRIEVYGRNFMNTSYKARFSITVRPARLCTEAVSTFPVDIQNYLEGPCEFKTPFLLTCFPPPWNPPNYTNIGQTIFSLNRNGEQVVSTYIGQLVFYFLKPAQWNMSNTTFQNSIFVETLDCGKLNLNFSAYGGLSFLRAHMEYTVLTPNLDSDFLVLNTNYTPTENEIMTSTTALPPVYFYNTSWVDGYDTNQFCIGPETVRLNLHSVSIPRKSWWFLNQPQRVLPIADYLLQPSDFELITSSFGDEIHGSISWTLIHGYEGSAYKICIILQHAMFKFDIEYSTRNCFYVVVPKCLKCVLKNETLSSISNVYGGTWLDLYSVNHRYFTEANRSVDGPLVDNNDIFYLVIPTLEKIRLGMVYHMKASDHLLNVAKQFGVSFYNLLELNPDLLRSDQYENLEGKRICILPSTSKFDKCMAPQATPNPYFYEADFPTPPYFYYGNQGRGVPIKQYNPLYPEAPIPVPPP